MNRSADGARSSPHYGGEGVTHSPIVPRCLLTARYGRFMRDPRRPVRVPASNRVSNSISGSEVGRLFHESRIRENCTSGLCGGRRPALHWAPPPTRQLRSRRTRPGNRARSWWSEGGDQGERGTASHAPGAGPGKCVTGAEPRTASRKAKKEGEVHLSPSHHSDAPDGVLCAQARSRTRCGRTDMAGLRG